MSERHVFLVYMLLIPWNEQHLFLDGLDIRPRIGAGIPLTPLEVRERTRKYAQTSSSRVDFTVITMDGSPIWNAHLFNIDPWARKAEYGIWIGEKSAWGQGYGTEVTHVVINFAFNRLNLHKVYLTVDADYPRAIRCYEKVGFKQDGFLRDDVFKNGKYVDRLLMSILKEEFNTQIPTP